MEWASLLNNMTKEKCSAGLRAVRNIQTGLPICGLTFLALAVFSTGCATSQVKDFTPKSGMICDEVRITGKFHYKIEDLDAVWFNGVRAAATFRHFPAPSSPLEILAVVPAGASNGPIRVKISAPDDLVFGTKGMDYTFGEAFSVTGSPPVPAINSFSANPAIIKPGESSTLSWQVSPTVKQVFLDDTDVSSTNSMTVSPTVTTIYYLVAKNESCLQQSQAVAVTVTPSPETAAPGTPVDHPGDTNTVKGGGLARTSESSPTTVFPGTTTATATVGLPADHQPAAAAPVPAPAPITAGEPVKAQPVAASDARKANTIAPIARKDGAFVDIKSKIGLASQTSGSRQLQISTNMTGRTLPGLAVFQQGGTILTQHDFQPGIIGGAAFSPGGDQAVSVTADPNGFSASYVDVIERFETHYKFQFPVNIMEGFKTATGRWHVLFSPDDTLVMVSSVPVAGPAKIAIQIHDLVRRKNIGTLIQANCKAGDLQGEVVNGNTVVIKLDGAVVATFPIN